MIFFVAILTVFGVLCLLGIMAGGLVGAAWGLAGAAFLVGAGLMGGLMEIADRLKRIEERLGDRPAAPEAPEAQAKAQRPEK